MEETTRKPPIKIGDRIKVKIETKGEKGDGISRINNFVIITPNTEEDKEYEVKIKKVFKKFAIAEKIETEK